MRREFKGSAKSEAYEKWKRFPIAPANRRRLWCVLESGLSAKPARSISSINPVAFLGTPARGEHIDWMLAFANVLTVTSSSVHDCLLRRYSRKTLSSEERQCVAHTNQESCFDLVPKFSGKHWKVEIAYPQFDDSFHGDTQKAWYFMFRKHRILEQDRKQPKGYRLSCKLH